jgi:hypothetical protein
MESQEAVQKRYKEAVASLVSKIKDDQNIIAAILGGSLSYDQVWEKSDIDMMLIQRDGKGKARGYSLVENDVHIHAEVVPRSEFRRWLESALQTSFLHSYFSRSTLVYCDDESIKEWYRNANLHNIGARDMALQLLTIATEVLPTLTYAEKQFHVNKDLNYSFLNILRTVERLARLEVIFNDEVPSREVIQPALNYNPDFFSVVYTDLINQKKDESVIENALNRVNARVDERAFTFFQPLLDYLAEAKAPRSITEINAFFEKKVDDDRLDAACEWLARKGVIQQVSVPMKLTVKSQVDVEEAAYYYDAEAKPSLKTPKTFRLKGEMYQQYQDALKAFADKIKQDRYVLAAILTSNLAADNVWEKTVINVILIMREGARFDKNYSLVEAGINIHATLYTRSQYKKLLEGGVLGDGLHGVLASSRILFTKDEAVIDWHKDLDRIGDRDQETAAMNAGSMVFMILAKAEKWFHVKRDFNYSFLYIMFIVEALARIETIMHGETPKRKAIYQALKYNPKFFNAVFTDIINIEKDEPTIRRTLELIDRYLEKRALKLFKPLFDFLSEAGGTRTATDIAERFDKRQTWVGGACEWLAQKGVIELFSSPLRLTKESPVSVEESAYYYDPDNPFLEDLKR